MELNRLSKPQYLKTMTAKMLDVTESAEALTDIWGYAEGLSRDGVLSEYAYNKRLVEAVYVNGDNTYHHVLLFAKEPNVYAVVIVDTIKKHIFGHYILDLNQEYGLIGEK